MFVCVLGRQPEISLAELEAVFSKENVSLVSDGVASVNSPVVDLSILGGTTKIGEVIFSLDKKFSNDKSLLVDASKKIVHAYTEKWQNIDHKITLGLSAYNFNVNPRDVQKTGLLLKSALKKHGVSLRLIPNDQPELSTATSHNNKLGLSDNKVELMIVNTRSSIIIAESHGAQNITAYARRDQNRPRRDAFVGMLPPKLAQIMLNLALGAQPSSASSSATTALQELADPPTTSSSPLVTSSAYNTVSVSDERLVGRLSSGDVSDALEPSTISSSEEAVDFSEAKIQPNATGWPAATRRVYSEEDEMVMGDTETTLTILDPFCGTGTVLQEALLRGFNVIGSDLNPKMIDYSEENLAWLQKTHKYATGKIINLQTADAMTANWPNAKNITAVVCETYLGQPFSAPPSPEKLKEVVGNCNHIISEFLKNIRPQLADEAKLCIAIPAWRQQNGSLTHLPLTKKLQALGFTQTRPSLIYARPDQVVNREIITLKPSA